MIKIPVYNQWSNLWGAKKLAPSEWTLANSGCFITSITMAMHNYSILLNPGEVLDKLVAAKALDINGMLSYDGLMRAFPSVSFVERVYTTNDPSSNIQKMQISTAVENIKRLLALGQPVVLCVDNLYNDGKSDHAVIAYEALENDFKIHDPDGGREILFSSKYGDIKTKLYGYVAICGPAISFPDDGDPRVGVAFNKLAQAKRGINKDLNINEAFNVLY